MGSTPVGTEDSFLPVNWLKCEKTAHLHKSSYTSILPHPPKPIRNLSGREHNSLTYHAVVSHGRINTSFHTFVKQWNSRDCSTGNVGSDTATNHFTAFFKVHCDKREISLTNDMNAHLCNKFLHHTAIRHTQLSARYKTFSIAPSLKTPNSSSTTHRFNYGGPHYPVSGPSTLWRKTPLSLQVK